MNNHEEFIIVSHKIETDLRYLNQRYELPANHRPAWVIAIGKVCRVLGDMLVLNRLMYKEIRDIRREGEREDD